MNLSRQKIIFGFLGSDPSYFGLNCFSARQNASSQRAQGSASRAQQPGAGEVEPYRLTSSSKLPEGTVFVQVYWNSADNRKIEWQCYTAGVTGFCH